MDKIITDRSRHNCQWTGRGKVVDLRLTCKATCYPQNWHAARKFTDTWSPHMRHTIVSTPSYLGTSQITRHDPKTWAAYFFIIYHNMYWFQVIMIPTAINIKKAGFYCDSHVLLLLFYNALMKLCCDLCHPHVSILGTLRWRHNGWDSVPYHQPHHCLLNRLFRHRSKKTLNLRVTAFVKGNHRGPVNFPHKWPVTRKMFPFDDVIIIWRWWWSISCTLSPEQYGGFKISTVVWTKTHSFFTPILFGVILLADFFVFYNSSDHW